MKRFFGRPWLSLLLCMTLFAGLCDEYCLMEQQAELSESVLRLHIRADSDSAAAQGRKLLLRDYLLLELSSILEPCSARAEAEAALASALPALSGRCERFLASVGMSETVRLSLRNERFPTREYSSVTLPFGEYSALVAELGSGTGQNWWCVVWPPLCLAASEASEAEALAVFSPDEKRLITSGGVVIRFRILERLQALFPKLFA